MYTDFGEETHKKTVKAIRNLAVRETPYRNFPIFSIPMLKVRDRFNGVTIKSLFVVEFFQYIVSGGQKEPFFWSAGGATGGVGWERV